ncbi:ABC transporter permease [Pedobacter sp. SAFR-022]|uniref:ABC transporter permease n=1 Tax=Pedobacter sp. SAFR-022 TaxID=3436861 RepID=UPI003F810310
MFKLHLKIAFRNLWMHATSSIINVIGLAIGLASCLMLMLYVSYEWNYDKQFKGWENVYQVMTNFEGENSQITSTGEHTGNMIAPTIKTEIPEVEAVARIGYGGQALIANGQKSFKREAKFADPDLLKIYNYEFVAGNGEMALSTPNSIIITESTARLLFPNGDGLNKPVRYNDAWDFSVSGIIKDLPQNSSNAFGILMPWSFYETLNTWVKEPTWGNFNWQTLVRLKENSDIAFVNRKMAGMMRKKERFTTAESFLFQLSEKHLYGKFVNGQSVGGEIERIYLFVALAAGILLIACVNFMNLATAKSERRAKEVAVKKTIGASRGSLIAQFITESMLLTMVSVVIAVALVEILLPSFNNLLHIDLQITYSNAWSWIGVVAVILSTGLIAGSYPALYLSSFNPITTLKKKAGHSGRLPISLRQVLVVGQFCFAIILIIATLVIYNQVQYIKQRPLGYDVSLLAEMQQEGMLESKYELLKSELLRSGAVLSMCQSSATIAHDGASFWGFQWPGMAEKDKLVSFDLIATTYDFINTNGIQLLAGRDFSASYASDTSGLLLSSAAVKVMGLKDPVGTRVKYQGEDATIVGVFKDFIWGSPYQSNKPMVVAFNRAWTGNITMRLNPDRSLSENIDVITRITKKINPAYPVEIKFVNDLYAQKLLAERTLGILANLFGGLAIFISCLGLFGLAAYSAEQRSKEFGVRKVLGASIGNIMQLLSMSFMKMILIAVLIGVPIAYYLMNNWLSHFEFRTTISWWIIVTAVCGTFLIAMLTISYQAFKTATSNLVDALKYE